jgi:hypothetical protein
MGKMADYEKILDGVGSPQELKKFYKDQGLGDLIEFEKPEPGKVWSLMEELSSCSGAALVTAKYFTGKETLGNAAGHGHQPEQLFAGQHTAFCTRFGDKQNRIAYVTGTGHDFIFVKEAGTYALYQANVETTPKYTLCKALNSGIDYNLRNMDAGSFAALLAKLTNGDESNKIFKNKNNITTYKAAFAEF